MAVIKDVANLAGVSISTVSKYLNNPSGLSEKYRQAVENAVRELNYTPNEIARGLRTKKTNTIALIVPDISNAFYTEVYEHVRSTAMSQGYITQLYTNNDSTEVLSNLLSQFSRSNIDGIIATFLDEDFIVKRLEEIDTNTPIALMSWDINSEFNSTIINLNEVMYTVTKHLIDQGHKKIAHLGGVDNSRISYEKMCGYKRAMSEAGLKIRDDYIYFGSTYRFKTGYQGAETLMMLDDSPTAIVAANDVLAIGACKYLQNHGYRIPDDIAVTGMDGVQLSKLYDPSITTMVTPIEEMCTELVSYLIYKINHPGSKNHQTIFKPTLRIGRSTDAGAPIYVDL